jgi:hypothetical protein
MTWPKFPLLVLVALATAGCGPTWNPDRDGIPRLATGVHLDPARVAKISRFRSGYGHDFSDSVERCRSMKQYFHPTGGEPGAAHSPSWTTLEVRSPVAGRVVRVEPERSVGSQLYLESSENRAFTFRIFHVAPEPGLSGSAVEAGALLGHHAGDETFSDVAVEVNRGLEGFRLVAFVETLTDEAFAVLQSRGVATREALVISREERDSTPLTCSGSQFSDAAPNESDWLTLR